MKSTQSKLGGFIHPSNSATDQEVLKKLGKYIARQRKAKKASPQDVEEHSGVSIATIKRMEAGHPTSTRNLIAVMRSLGVLNELLNFIQAPKSSPVSEWERKKTKKDSTPFVNR